MKNFESLLQAQCRARFLQDLFVIRSSFPTLYQAMRILVLAISLISPDLVQSQIFDPPKTGPYESVAGLFFIKTYLIYTESNIDQWATNLGTTELAQRSKRSYEVLNGAYNKHGIFFIAAEQEEGCYEVVTTLPTYTDGLSILIYSDAGPTQGATLGPWPTLLCSVQGNENGIPGSNLSVLVHEVGHCLGLAHPHDEIPDACSNGECIDPEIEDSDHCCGDLIDDTPPHMLPTTNGGFVIVDSNCESSIEPTGVPPVIFKNYMNYTRPEGCRDRFTPEQERRMRWYLANSSDLALALVSPEAITANTSVTWSATQTKEANVEVQSGATLTVNAQISMNPGTYIIVRPGGTLIINNTITAACSGMWGGVIVEGTSSSPQMENSQYSEDQGIIRLNEDGIIEHAVIGINLDGLETADSDLGGGIAEIRGLIRNCITGISFGPYRDGGKPNVSFLIDAYLALDDDYRAPIDAKKPVLLQLREINRLSVTGTTTFNDARTEDCDKRSSRADGLVADDAGILVSQCFFFDLDHGVLASPLLFQGGHGSYEVRQSSFFDCFTAIHSNLPDPFDINNNFFSINRPTDCALGVTSEAIRGVYVAGHTMPLGMMIMDNHFETSGNYEEETLVGTDCISTGIMENFVRNNNYEGLDYGNRAIGNNGGATGLRYECNENENAATDFSADFYVASGSIRSIQGDFNGFGEPIAVGNIFSSGTFSWINNGSPITYHYLNITEQDPINAGTGFLGTIDPVATNNPNLNCGSGSEGPFDEEDVKTLFFQAKSDWKDKTAIYPTLSGTEAEEMAKEIVAHRSAMDTLGGKIIRLYALDTTEVNADSVLQWTEHLQAYQTDLRLARHYFFKGDYSAYDDWLTEIPNRNELSMEQSSELADFELVLAIIQPHLETGILLHQLPATVLDSLEQWASACTEPGFIAKEILRRNGRGVVSECEEEPEERPVSGIQIYVSHDIRIFPNPTRENFFVEMPAQAESPTLYLYTLDGRLLLQQVLTSSTEVKTSGIPHGFYICRIVAAEKILFHSKLILSH